jgi:2-oxo-4-hydroxy-4-carboxy-5-ureidoimidazoline decarboxylase
VTMTGLAGFNILADDVVREALGGCCSSACWIEAVAAGRPYQSEDALLAASDAAVAAMSEADLSEAMAGHPRIGDRPAPASWSSQEQARLGHADAGTLQALADGNVSYEQQFGHIYLACAAGRSADELLAFLRERLGNDRDTEWQVVAGELAKINRIRLRKLLGGQG